MVKYTGVISVLLSILSLFSQQLVIYLRVHFQIHTSILAYAIIFLIVSLMAVYLGILARRNGSKIFGIAGITLGVITALIHASELYLVIGGFTK